MRRNLALVLGLCVAVGVGGCGGADNDAADPDTTPAADTQPADTNGSDAPDVGGGFVVPGDMVAIPAGSFVMGDHSGLGGEDPKHPSDELPLHTVQLSAFHLGRFEVTCAQYAEFLNASQAAGLLEVTGGEVRGKGATALWFETSAADPTSPISFGGGQFTLAADRIAHPITHVRWEGAAAFANWRSQQEGLTPCIDIAKGTVDVAARCYRLPTEAEWEYAALAGRHDPWPIYPWGDAMDPTRANWPASGDPWETGPEPRTTPVGFFDGSLRQKADFGWPGPAATWQTGDGANPWGLHDMAGNVWEWTNDWYRKDYYAVSPAQDPTGPIQAEASPMPDGKPYRGLKGGNWCNGTTPDRMDGHSRISNRDPSYYRGPGDPDGPWFHIGFRLLLAHAGGGS
ncbi:MAG: formylglycine-generating enzyme family protein [Myxococcota bacterium]